MLQGLYGIKPSCVLWMCTHGLERQAALQVLLQVVLLDTHVEWQAAHVMVSDGLKRQATLQVVVQMMVGHAVVALHNDVKHLRTSQWRSPR